jgi:Helicase C-terminal domain
VTLAPRESPQFDADTLIGVSKFVTRRDTQPTVDSPEALFRSLRPSDSGVRHLWAHQADLMRDYSALPANVTDVAVELPTGAGKTLVGQLLGEYRRRALGHRVAYLCPNSQLAAQAAEKAAGYGIDAVLLVGRRADYDRADYTAFMRANAIAITNYHSVFNSNPAIEAQTLVLDDAHAGEGAVADLWSVAAERGEPLYAALASAVADALPRPFVERLGDMGLDPRRRSEVELVPPLAVVERADILRDAIDEHARDHNVWSGQMIADEIGHCLIYVSWDAVLIRPLIPPTSEHAAFADAEQRIYMSATLGAGGELERSFGVTKIERLAVPAGWDEHGSGRRFFLFPAAVQDVDDVDACVAGAIERAGKALVLAPSRRELDSFQATAVPASVPTIRSGDAERDLTTFMNTASGAVLLANRYDGIDLPDEACRLVVLTGLPAATHLQERFLHDILGARRVLAERIRTRIVQGAGRCTRNVQDYAAVIVRGARLTDFCARDEVLRAMHPELQAEVRFGLDNSERADAALLELLESFLDQDADWLEADAFIRASATEASREQPEMVDELAEAAPLEVECWRAVWRGDLRRAIELAQEATDHLGSGSELRPYRALWLYLAASWAAELAVETDDERDAEWASTLKRDAEGTARMLRWRPRVEPKAPTLPAAAEFDERAERAADKLRRLGIRGLGFERKLTEIEQQLAEDGATPFELGLRELGELLGFEAERPTGTAAPDGAWRDGERLWLIFEAKTEERPENPVSVTEARQAASHHDWIKGRLGWEEPEQSLSALVSYKTFVDPAAAAVARDVMLVDPVLIREIAARAIAVYREVRPRARALTDEQLAATLAAEFRRKRLRSDDLLGELGERRLADG